MCFQWCKECRKKYYSSCAVVFTIFWYQIEGIIFLMAISLSSSRETHEEGNGFPIFFALLTTGLGILLSIGAISHKPKVVLVVLIIGILKLVFGLLWMMFTNSQQIGFSDFGRNIGFLGLLAVMQHGIYVFYKGLIADVIISRNRNIIVT